MAMSDQPEEEAKARRRSPLIPIAVGVAVLAVVVLAVVMTPAKQSSPDSAGDGPPPDPGVAQIGSVAPSFKLKTIDDSVFDMASHRGKVVLINFWGTWCPPCEKEMPHLVEVYHRYNKSTVFVAIAVNDVPDAVRRFVAEKRMDFPVGLDEGQIAGRYLVSGFPTTVIVGTDGVVKEKFARAFPDAASIESALQRAGATANSA
ncbi:MAG: hypothetical protein DCC49_05855 [Acidobacteria bacterium]|nr:MAG: hypothetical protein DCC49_05855 [Acidobacteriota bacterium]